MLKERMTPEEIAHLTGYSRQTINKWVRKEGWQTSPRPGVQGGKARLGGFRWQGEEPGVQVEILLHGQFAIQREGFGEGTERASRGNL